MDKMAELKTKPNDAKVEDFLNSVEDEKKKEDSFTILKIMKEITKAEPVLWGGCIIGFGIYRYKYASGREGDWFLTGFSPRKQNLTLHIMSGFKKYKQLLSKLGKYKTGKACLYINKLENIDMNILKELITQSINHLKWINK